MAGEQDGDSFFARTCISPYQSLASSATSVETEQNPNEAEADYENTKYEFNYICKRYRANIKDIKANEGKIEKNKLNFGSLNRQEKLDIRKQIVANQYLHTKNEVFLNRILDILRTGIYVPENPEVALSMIRLYQQFQNDATQGIQSSQLVLKQLFQNGAVYDMSDTCHLNEQRILGNDNTISQFEMEAKLIKQTPKLTFKVVEHLKNITMLCRGLLKENRALLNENKNLYLQSSNIRQMAGNLGDCVNVTRRIVRCIGNLEANQEEFHFLLRSSAELTSRNLAQKEELEKGQTF